MTSIYQITDTHVPLANDEVRENFSNLMTYVEKNPADILVLTGDLPGVDGSTDVYQWMKEQIPQQQKYYVIPGNHDNSQNLFQVFGKEVCGNKDFLFTIGLDEIDLVFTDTSSTRFPKEQLDYLSNANIRSDSILFTHFPTKKVSDGFMDRTYPLGNIEEADQVIRQSSINHVFCGHFHTEHYVHDGYHLYLTPSPAFSIALNEPEIIFTERCMPLRKINISGKDVKSEVVYF